jgi:hypothetical protein
MEIAKDDKGSLARAVAISVEAHAGKRIILLLNVSTEVLEMSV